MPDVENSKGIFIINKQTKEGKRDINVFVKAYL